MARPFGRVVVSSCGARRLPLVVPRCVVLMKKREGAGKRGGGVESRGGGARGGCVVAVARRVFVLLFFELYLFFLIEFRNVGQINYMQISIEIRISIET